jgi:uncharacterized protein with HEPN domain
MNDEIKKYLYDIAESIDSIEKYLGERLDFSVSLMNKSKYHAAFNQTR